MTPDDPRLLRLVEELETATRRPSIEISTRNTGPLAVGASKLGGVPYLPPGAPAPQGEHGPLTFLTQIRLEDLPANDFMPKTGLLQFWIGRDDVYGVDFDDLRAGDFKVIHYPSIDESVSEEDVLARYTLPPIHDPSEPSPFETNDPYALTFAMTQQALTMTDYSFEQHVEDLWDKHFPEEPYDGSDSLPYPVQDLLEDRFLEGGHRLGGYPWCVQDDPREDSLEEEAILLLQIDSDDAIDWGVSGVAHFFILPQELAAGDFSRVAYTWDRG